MKGDVKSNERMHCKIQVCLQNLALRKLKTSMKDNHENSNETTNTCNKTNSNPKPLNSESSLTELSTSKERVDLLQDFQSQELQIDIRSRLKVPRRAIEKYVRKKENGHVIETGMATNARILPRNARLSLPILQVESLENISSAKRTYPKFVIKNEINVEHNGNGDVTINGINREILENVSFHDDNKKDIHKKEIEDIAQLVSQDVSRVEETLTDNPIMAEEQSTGSRHYLKRADSHEKHLMEDKNTIDEPIQSVSKRVSEEYSSFENYTLDWKFWKAYFSVQNKNCTSGPIEHNVQNKQIPIDKKRHFHRNRKCLANEHDKHASSYLATSIDENITDNSFYQCVHHYCGEDMINDLSSFHCCCEGKNGETYGRWDIQKGTLSSSRNEHRRYIRRVRGNSSISCGCKCKVTPSSQRVTFCLPRNDTKFIVSRSFRNYHQISSTYGTGSAAPTNHRCSRSMQIDRDGSLQREENGNDQRNYVE